MREQMNWYIDNNQYLSKAFLEKIITYCDEANESDIPLKNVVQTHEPTIGNPSSQLTFARDLGVIDNDSKLTDLSILFKAGVIEYADYALSVFSKRNVTKFEAIPLKPLVLLSKVFFSFNTLGIPDEERFLTAFECIKYLSVLSSYDEYTDAIAEAIVSDRIYGDDGAHLPVRPGGTPVQWLCIFNLLESTILFKFVDGARDTIAVNYDYIELIAHIATHGPEMSLAPTTQGRNNASLCAYYSDIGTGITELIPQLSLISDSIPRYFTRDLFNYLFGVESGRSFPWQEYLNSECFGIYREFFPVHNLVIAKIYAHHPTVGEQLWDYIVQAGDYSTYTREGKLVIIPPFAERDHTGIENLVNRVVFETGLSSSYKRNRIVFGAPGTGKSFSVNQDRIALLGDECDVNYERVTFHPEYTYANFVGSYKPIPTTSGVSYEFVPGPFMRVYVKALRSARNGEAKPFLLLIEEINRADVAAVFGDVFQLLDRGENNASEYPIQATEEMKNYLSQPTVLGGVPDDYSFIRIPDNMFIWATMNSADQGVFPMDTAFKRRWDFSYIGIDQGEQKIENCQVSICGRIIKWNKLRKAINDQMIASGINEDKLLGPFFLPLSVLPSGDPENDGFEQENADFLASFENKVIMYLFTDAVKQRPSIVFAAGDDNSVNIRQYSSLCAAFRTKGLDIFVRGIAHDRDLL